jgi:F-type H+-transporting ATPase subunit a
MASNLKLIEKQTFTLKLSFMKNLLFCLFTLFSAVSFANEDSLAHSETAENHEGHTAKFDAGEFITHHIADAHEIHFFTLNEKTENEKHFSIYLPIILKTENGIEVFSSSHFYHNQSNIEVNGKHKHYFVHDGYVLFDEQIYKAQGATGIEFNESGKILNASVLDLSPTKSVVGMFITIIILVLLFGSAARRYKANPNSAPKGLQSLLEPLILFIRDEVAIPSIGKDKADRFVPFPLNNILFHLDGKSFRFGAFFGRFQHYGNFGSYNSSGYSYFYYNHSKRKSILLVAYILATWCSFSY